MCLCLVAELSAGGVLNKNVPLIPPQKLNMWQLVKQLRKQFGSKDSLWNLEWYLWCDSRSQFTVTAAGQSHSPRNPEAIKVKNMYRGNITWSEKLCREVTLPSPR
ncbi:hypothetical protein AAC387_Pa08g1173 [Persea americana]